MLTTQGWLVAITSMALVAAAIVGLALVEDFAAGGFDDVLIVAQDFER